MTKDFRNTFQFMNSNGLKESVFKNTSFYSVFNMDRNYSIEICIIKCIIMDNMHSKNITNGNDYRMEVLANSKSRKVSDSC